MASPPTIPRVIPNHEILRVALVTEHLMSQNDPPHMPSVLSDCPPRITAEKWRKRATAVTTAFWLLAASVIGTSWKEESPVGLTLFSLACLLMGVGVIGRSWCLANIAGRKTTELITDGPYSLCQNPLYFFSAVGAIGVGLASCTIVFPLIVLTGFCVYYPSVMRSEARRLTEQHGEAYLAYRRTTRVLIPSFSRFHESADHCIQSRAFRRGSFDAIWFFIAFAWMHALAELHRSGHVVAWWFLP